MSRTILKSNGAFVLIGDPPSWKINGETGRLFSLVQNLSFGLTNERQQLKQIGYKNYIVNHINRSPTVNLTIDYYLSPYLNNEFLLGFGGRSTTSESFFSSNNSNLSNNNFYVIIDNQNGRDAISEARKKSPQTINFSGYDVLSFGNCYLNNYNLSFSIGNIPVVSTSYSCSNMKIDDLTGNILTIPAINHQSGNANNAGSLNLGNSTYPILSGYLDTTGISGLDISKLPVVSPRISSFTLENLQVGGIPLSSQANPILQNLNINLDFKREDLYGLGSNYVYDRKLQYPINGSIEIQALVSGFSSGFISGLFNNESDYDFNIAFKDTTNNPASGSYKFTNAKLENFNYSMQVNNIMNFSASFSVEIINESGFYISRYVSGSEYWDSVQDLWSLSNITWQ